MRLPIMAKTPKTILAFVSEVEDSVGAKDESEVPFWRSGFSGAIAQGVAWRKVRLCVVQSKSSQKGTGESVNYIEWRYLSPKATKDNNQ